MCAGNNLGGAALLSEESLYPEFSTQTAHNMAGLTVGVLACGTMGTAVLTAVVNAVENASSQDVGFELPSKFYASVSSQSSKSRLEDHFGDKVTVIVGDNKQLIENSDIVILGCKPFMVETIFNGIPSPETLFKNKVMVSLLAGKSIAWLRKTTGCKTIARAMTTTPAQIGAAMTIISFSEKTEDSKIIEWMFNQTGKCQVMDEKYQDVATGLCGSGTGFMFLVMESLIDGGVRMGLPYAIAQECAAQVMVGAGRMAQESGKHPAQLKSSVCTPGGTTIGGLLVLEDKAVRSSIARAVEESTNIAKQLGQ